MYVELHAHSYFSLLDGVPSPEELVQRAVEVEMPALALTDHDAVYGAVRFEQAARQAGLKPIFGAEITLVNGGGHLTLLAESDQGYANLCRLITLARRDQQKGFAALPWRLLANHHAGLIALSGCRHSEIARALLDRHFDKARQAADRFASIFGAGNFFLELQRHHERGDRRLTDGLVALGQRLHLPLVATGDVHYLDTDEAPIHDVLTCIRQRVPLTQANGYLRSNHEYRFRSSQEMALLFADQPAALRATLEIAERCQVQLPSGPQRLPLIDLPPGQSAIESLRDLCEAALTHRVTRQVERYHTALQRELAVIAQHQFAEYFLVVWDAVRFARSQGILCQGRGSAANSLVAYLLDITPVDPIAGGLVFERFLSAERASVPDIDVDFAADRRETVIQYLYQKHGPQRVAMACTFVTFGARQALRDVGMVLGFSGEVIDRVCETVDVHSSQDLASLPGLRSTFGAQLDSFRWQQWLALASRLDAFPRHLGIHNGGLVLMVDELSAHIPIEPASMEERFVIQWDKDALETQRWIKFDVLGLRALSAINDACDIVEQQTGRRPDLAALRFDDRKVYDLICSGRSLGIFQIESRAQASLIPRFQPRNLSDLTIEIALIRPGPVQGNMVHPFLNRRDALEPVRYLHPALESALKETLGVVLFQEQCLKVAHDFAGFTHGEGELLRRALGHKRADDLIETFRDRFLQGAQAKGVARSIAEQVFQQLKAFGGYSFAKSHAAAFAVIVYWSAWLKCNHPTAFYVGLLRNEPMGFYPRHVVVSDAIRYGLKVLPVDLRYSQAAATAEGQAIRLGLIDVKGFGPAQIELIEVERQRGPFHSLADLVRRTQLDRPHVEALVLAGALDHFGERRQLLWDLAEAYRLAKRPRELSLRSPDERAQLPPMDRTERLVTAYAATGVSLDAHLTELRRDAFTKAGAISITSLAQVKHGQRVKIGGLLVALQRPPTAKGFAFLAIEDPTGMVNVILAPDVYAQYRSALQGAFVLIEGVVQKDHGAINVVAQRIEAI